MIYRNQESAERWATALNARPGYPTAYAVRMASGDWTVIASYRGREYAERLAA